MPGELNAEEVVVAGNGAIWIAPKGSAVPATAVATPSNDWINLGFLDEDGVDLTAGAEWNKIMAWQSLFPIRRVAGERELTLGMKLMQWNSSTVPFAFGGGEVVQESAGNFRYNPPSPGDIDERMMLVDWNDGDKNYRWVILNGMVSDDVETNLTRADASKLGISFTVNGVGDEVPWFLRTNDPAFQPLL